ncbi:MAG: hypothetical protein O7E54_02405 [Planctomycetota bacterium]|jgi:uncharacterized membrane protein|nr:hypothetical protein [Planctomycetota bacterium]
MDTASTARKPTFWTTLFFIVVSLLVTAFTIGVVAVLECKISG